jgi:ATP-dependent helicase HrpA
LQLREQIKFLEKSLASLQTAQMQASTVPALAAAWPGFEALREQVIAAALDRACLGEPWPHDRAGFVARKDEARGRLSLIAQEVARLAALIAQEAAALPKKLAAHRGFAAAAADIEQQLGRLFARNFLVDTPPAQLAHYPRYLKAIAMRLDKLKADPARDQGRQAELAALQTPWLRETAARKGVADPRLQEFRWLLEELRVSLFAQELRTPMPVSTKRLQKVWASVQR